MTPELVSVVMCTYNGEKFLEKQIQSILSQTYQNLELIITDDCSTDGTKNILEKYKSLPNVFIHYNENNLGFTKNFEKAASLAKANYICFADQDDIWLPNKVQQLFKAIADKSMIYSNSLLIDDNDNSLGKHLSNYRKLQNINSSKCFAFLNAVSGHTMMIEKRVLETGLPIPQNTYHDWWLAVIASNLNGIIYLDEVLTHYRQHSKTVTKTIVNKKIGSRTKSKRFIEFEERLYWLGVLKENKQEKNLTFYNNLYYLYSLKQGNSFVWSLFWFLLLNRKYIFGFSKKNLLSQIVEIRKFARGEKGE